MSKPKLPDSVLPAELRVFIELGDDKNYEEAANALFISKHTAKTHARNARERNNVKTNLAVYKIALDDGLLIVVKNANGKFTVIIAP